MTTNFKLNLHKLKREFDVERKKNLLEDFERKSKIREVKNNFDRKTPTLNFTSRVSFSNLQDLKNEINLKNYEEKERETLLKLKL